MADRNNITANLFKDINQWIETQHAQITVSSLKSNYLKYNGVDYFLVGKADNLKRIAALNSIDINLPAIEICICLLEKNGWDFINQLKGYFAFIANNESEKELLFTIGNAGLMQSYIHQTDKDIFIFSELKALKNTSVIERKMIPIETYQYEYTTKVEQDFCFLQNIKRVLPGFLYSCNYKNIGLIIVDKIGLAPVLSSVINDSKKEAKEKIYTLLNENIQDKINTDKIGAPVSGGLDSGLVASMLHQQSQNIYTYTIGTQFGNEFDNAKEVQQYTRSSHQEINIDTDGFWEGFLGTVWHNEICDPLYAEGYVGFYHVFKQAQKNVSQLFTGYGADLILGDFLVIKDRTTINSFSEYWCKRAAWTGEMSPYLAQSFGIEIQHPFWEIDLINFSLSIPYEYKYAGDEVKAVLREIASEKKLLPDSIAWRKKNAFTTGASLDQLFSHCLRIPYEKNYHFKSIFLYYLFEELFVLDKNISSIDTELLLTKTKNYAG